MMMIKPILLTALSAALMLGTSLALADHERGDELHERTSVRAQQTATAGRGTGHHVGRAVRGAGSTVVHGAQTAGHAVHAAEHQVRRGRDARTEALRGRTRDRATETSRAARVTGQQTVRGANRAGATVVHGAQTGGNAVREAGHDVKH